MIERSLQELKISQIKRVNGNFSVQKLYLIICKGSMLSLRQQPKLKKFMKKQKRIMGSIQDRNDVKQLWMFLETKHKNNHEIKQEYKHQKDDIKRSSKNESKYQISHDTKQENKEQSYKQNNFIEIVNFESDNVVDSEDNDVRLLRGQQKLSQCFEIELVSGQQSNKKQKSFKSSMMTMKQNKFQQKIYRIRNQQGYYLFLDGILQNGEYNQQDTTQQFIIKEVQLFQPYPLTKTYLIQEPITKKCLDVYGADKFQGTAVVCWPPHYRANQRWLFQPQLIGDKLEHFYYIKSYSSNKYLSVKECKTLVDSQTKYKWVLKDYHNVKQGVTKIYSPQLSKYIVMDNDGELQLNEIGQKWQLINSK